MIRRRFICGAFAVVWAAVVALPVAAAADAAWDELVAAAQREGKVELFGPREQVMARLMKPATEVRAVEAAR